MNQGRKDQYFLLSLGCSKNTVDSESMAQLLDQSGMASVGDPGQAEVLIVNTCGFIGPAKTESIEALRGLAAGKSRDQYLIAAGCLSQRYGEALAQEVAGLDGIIGTRRWMDIVDLVQRLRARKHPEPLYHLPTEAATVGRDEQGAARVSVQGASAYLKIADGCRRPCAFCAIPAIKGTAVSRPVASILDEARLLRDKGVQEIILIAQDSTDYGHDLGMKNGLAHLLRSLVKAVPDVPWLRVMYAYPGYVTDDLIETMASHDQITNYLDIPLQHAHRQTLLRMRRPANTEWVYRTLEKMRGAMPDLAIRTTFIVGYPGETEEEFETLVNFVQDIQFDRVGAFTYSYEIGTPSATLPDQVDDAVKATRRDRLMETQQAISLRRNQAQVGKVLDVLVEGHAEVENEAGTAIDEVISLGRSYRDAPEIDGYVMIEGEAPAGEIVPVRITGAMLYDLVGTVDVGGPVVIQPGQIYGAGDLPTED
ncbi:MAG: 30S ribosomal protein S12 methylthiotransferase RimO [Chloroflexi bacterium]|nr:30S ribosomal protein S12 methylthiotransferase RimO [Chloroflexota bacterium]